jgi:hypothetical protein
MSNHDVTERQAHDDQPVQVPSGETQRSPVAKLPGSAEMPGPKRGGATWRLLSLVGTYCPTS